MEKVTRRRKTEHSCSDLVQHLWNGFQSRHVDATLVLYSDNYIHEWSWRVIVLPISLWKGIHCLSGATRDPVQLHSSAEGSPAGSLVGSLDSSTSGSSVHSPRSSTAVKIGGDELFQPTAAKQIGLPCQRSVWTASLLTDACQSDAQRVANQALTVSPQPAVAVEGPASKMSPPTNDVTNGVAPPTTVAPRVPPTTNPALVQTNRTPAKYTPKDFIFGKVIGEGSFGTVYLAKDIHTSKEYAIKVCDKRHIIKEKKTEYVTREKEVLNMLSRAKHFFVRLYCTFQDVDRLYFVLSYAKNGELLPYINKVGSFDIECTKFYSAEILRGLEYLHGLGIIHRDLKPENILLDEKMHVLITDFGCTKILKETEVPVNENETHVRERKNSFVGTAQYLSPEILTDRNASRSSDLWAFGCIIYQMVAGLPPFRARNDYMIFQKIQKLDYEIPDGFSELAKTLVERLLVLDPTQRLGAQDEHGAGYPSIRAHPFFDGVDFETLHEQTPPPIYPYLPGTSEHEELRSHYRVPDHLEPGLDDKQMTRLLGLGIGEEEKPEPIAVVEKPRKQAGIADLTPDEIKSRLKTQRSSNKWDYFVEGNLILKQGLVHKRKGLFARRRMLLLTTGPHLYYVDIVNMVLKGEIPWSPELRVEPKNFKIFFIHTPNRTYYLEDPDGFALEWCRAIEEMRVHYYGLVESTA